MLRSNHGCWSCRIRRKKCDETKPVCTTCTSRNITCHGYGSKPEWLDGGDQEKLIARDLKNQIADNLRKNRKRKTSRNRDPSRAYAGDSSRLGNAPGVMHGALALDTNPIKLPFSSLTATSSTVSERLSSYREAELIMHYMDAVFPLQFRFHVPDPKGRGWLLWLLVQSGPLYHAALSLSALHQSIRMSGEFRNSYTELANYHAQALTDLRQFIQRIQDNNDTDERSRKIEVLSCGVSLISFEVIIKFLSRY
jgi:C6 transcription factor Pro1